MAVLDRSVSGWKRSMRLQALEVIEGFEAVRAAVERLARRRTELAEHARAELGDMNKQGTGQRAAGRSEHPQPQLLAR